MRKEKIIELLEKLLDMEEKQNIGGLTAQERKEFQQEVKKTMNKQVPQSPVTNDEEGKIRVYCPRCGNDLGSVNWLNYFGQPSYCDECGQLVDKKYKDGAGSHRKLQIPLNEKITIVTEFVEAEVGTEFPPSINTYLTDEDDSILQDICVVRPSCKYQPSENKFVVNNSFVQCLVWGNPDDEDCTDDFIIGIYDDGYDDISEEKN